MESENRSVVVRAWGCGMEWMKYWRMNTNSSKIYLWGDESVLKLDSGNGCTILYAKNH